jgi:hypothetical protein
VIVRRGRRSGTMLAIVFVMTASLQVESQAE